MNAVNGTVIFSFRLTIDLRRFDNDLEFINVALIQNNFAERILFSFSNYQQERHLSISKHGGIDAVNASNVFPEITLIENRIAVYEDYVIYTFEDDLLFDMELVTIELDLNIDILGNNSENTEERTPFAVATVTLIQEIPQGCFAIITTDVMIATYSILFI